MRRTCLYRVDQRVIERTTIRGKHRDQVVRIVEASPDRVVTETGLTYTGLGMSDLEGPAGYRSIRDTAYPEASKP